MAGTSIYATDPKNNTTYTAFIVQVYLHYTSKDENMNTVAGCGPAL